MRSWIVLSVLVCSLLTATPNALAKEPLRLRGTEGIWFSLPETERIVEEIEIREQIIRHLRAQVATSTMALTESQHSVRATREWGELGWQSYRDEVKRGSAWYTQPIFWVVVGFVFGGVTGGIAAWRTSR